MKHIDSKYSHHIFICHGSKCAKNGAEEIRSTLRKTLKSQGLKAKISKTSCQSLCKHGCIVFAQAKDEQYAWQEVRQKDIPTLATKLQGSF